MMNGDIDGALEKLFNPKSIAIVGASEKTLYGKGILQYLLEFNYDGKIFPINPKRDNILGIKAYQSLDQLREPVDTAIIIVKRDFVLGSLKQCADIGIKSCIVITAGFNEADEKGKQMEADLIRFAHENAIHICGPNCAGIGNIGSGILLCMLREEGRQLLPGNIGFVSQSGALMMTLTSVAADRGVGVSHIASTGNECDLEVSDFIKYYLDNKETTVITAFVEGLKDVQKFSEVADLSVEKEKPIIVLKVGRSDLGKSAAASHTAHLTGSDSAYEALFKQKGIIRAYDTYDLFEIAKIFSAPKRPKGDGILILTSSGGTGSLTADLCGDLGMNLPEISPPVIDQLLKLKGLLTFGGLSNPADIRGQGMGIIEDVLPPLLADDAFSVILICLAFSSVGPGLAQNIGPKIIEISKSTHKPIVVLWIGRKKFGSLTDRICGFDLLEENGIPVYEKPETCLKAIQALINWTQFINRHQSTEPPETFAGMSIPDGTLKTTLDQAPAPLDEYHSKKVISHYGIPVTAEKMAGSLEEALTIADEIKYPVVLKVMSAQIPHKTEAGVVALDVSDGESLKQAYHQILANAKAYVPEVEIQGVLVQEQAAEGTEVILGVSHDLQFGPVVMFGMGGIFVEVYKDVSFRLPPLDHTEAERMIREVNGYAILKGVRGKPAADIDSLVDTIVKLSRLAVDLKDSVKEIDINPLLVCPKGKSVKALDALIVPK